MFRVDNGRDKTVQEAVNMEHAHLVCNLERHRDLDARRDGFNLPKAIIGVLTYNVIFIPVFSFMIVRGLHLGGESGIPIAMAWFVAGIYVTEHFVCRNTW
jgi:uncharacterized membrane protein (DUF485 family)